MKLPPWAEIGLAYVLLIATGAAAIVAVHETHCREPLAFASAGISSLLVTLTWARAGARSNDSLIAFSGAAVFVCVWTAIFGSIVWALIMALSLTAGFLCGHGIYRNSRI